MKTKRLFMVVTWLLLLPVTAWCQATSAAWCPPDITTAINANGDMATNSWPAGVTRGPLNIPQVIFPFFGNTCFTGTANLTGPTITNWTPTSGTPDAMVPDATHPNLSYLGAQATENSNNGTSDVYESFSTTVALQPNTTYNITYKVAVKNIRGTTPALIEVINRTNTVGFNTNCAGNTPLLPVNGTILLSSVVAGNTPNNPNPPVTPAQENPPRFETVCGSFTTGANPTNIVWVRVSLNGVVTGLPGNAFTSNYVYIDDFYIMPASTAQCTNPVTLTANCNGTITASIAAGFTNTTFQWFFNGNAMTNADGTFVFGNSITVTAGGTYSVQARPDFICPITQTINYTPSRVTISQICEDGNMKLRSSYTGQAMPQASYQWFLDGNPIPGANSPGYTPTVNGAYTLRISNTAGCSVISLPLNVIITTASLQISCQNGVNTLTAVVTPATSGVIYRWYRGTTLLTSGTSSVYVPTSGGTYRVEAVLPGGCVVRTEDLPVVLPSVVAIHNCTAGYREIYANVSPVIPGAYYQWYYNGTVIPGATASNYVPTQDGNYQVIVTTSTGCTYRSQVTTVTLMRVTLNSPTISALCQNQSAVSITANVAGGVYPFTYVWTGPGIVSQSGSSVTVNAAGTYTVVVTDALGCRQTVSTDVLSNLNVICPAPVCPGGTPTLQLANASGVIGNYVAGWYNVNDLSPNPELHSVITEEGDYYAVVVSPVCTLKTATPCHITFLAHPDPIILTQSGSGFGCSNTITDITVTNPGVNDANGDGNYFNDGVTYQWNTGEVNDLNNRTVTGYGSWNISAQNTTTGCITTSNTVGLSGPQLNINRTCVNGQIILNAAANFATGTYHWYLYDAATGTRVEITNPAQLLNGGASLLVQQAGIYIVTNDASNAICPGVEAKIYENMVTTSPTHVNQVSATDGQFDNLANCAAAKSFTSGLAGCIDRSAYTIGDPNYIDPSTYGINLPDHYMINQPGLNANAWNPGYWQGTGYNSETFMIVDGQPKLSETVVWSLANVPVTSGYNYLYKAMVRNISANASSVGEEIPSIYLRVRYNSGGSYSEHRQVLYANSQWVELTALAPALGYIDGSMNVIQPTMATLEIVVEGGNIVGRDLGIDNITFVPYGLCDAVETACGSSATVQVAEKTVCAGLPVTFNVIDNVTNPNIQYNWTEVGVPGSVPVNTKDFTVTPTSTTEYLLTVTNTQMLCSFTKVVKANVITPVPVNAGQDVTICQGLTTQLNATGAVTYNWGSQISIPNRYTANPVVGPFATQIYTVTGTDAAGCITTDQVTVTVLQVPLINAGPDVSICFKGAGSIKALGTTNTTYAWTPTNGLSSATVLNPIATPLVTTTYTLTATRDNGCVSTDQVIVTVATKNCNVPVYDGDNDLTTVPANNAYNVGTGDFTLEAWTQPATTQSSMPTILSRRAPSGVSYAGFVWSLSFAAKQMVLQIGTTTYQSVVMPNVFDGMCHHLAVRRQGSNITFFVDGIAISTTGGTTVSMNATASTTLRFGNDILGGRGFKGGIQEVRMWNVARSNAQISANLLTVFNPSTSNLIGYWRFKQLSNQVAADESGVRNDGVYGTTSASEATDPQLTGTACAPLRTPENPTDVYDGLVYNYYVGDWNVLPDFYTLPSDGAGIWSDISLGMEQQSDYFGVTFDGYINVPYDGYYTFYLSSNDGSRMYIGSNLVVDNDGIHTLQEKTGTIGLKAGKHAFRVSYFEKTNANIVALQYSGPGIAKQTVPASAFFFSSNNLRTAANAPELGTTAKITAYPNPFDQSFKVIVLDENNSTGTAKIKLINVYGVEVYQGTVAVNQENTLSPEIPAGVYVILVTLEDGQTHQYKIIKE